MKRRLFIASGLVTLPLRDTLSGTFEAARLGINPSPTAYSIEQALDGMIGQGGKHDLPLIGQPPKAARYHGSFIAQGGQPNSGSVPSWGPRGHTGKRSQLWPEMIPFYVLYDAVGHGKNLNAGVYMSPVQALYLSRRTGQWVHIQTLKFGVHWVDKRILPYDTSDEGDFGSWSKRHGPGVLLGFDANDDYGPSRGLVGHGWAAKAGRNRPFPFDPADCCALRVRCAAHLALRNPKGIDDRAKAKYLLSIGADYYPPTPDIAWNPAAGTSRGVLVTNEPKIIEFNSVEGAFDVDRSGRDIDPISHTKTALEWVQSRPSLVYTF